MTGNSACQEHENDRPNSFQALREVCRRLADEGLAKIKVAYSGFDGSGVSVRIEAFTSAGKLDEPLPGAVKAVIEDFVSEVLGEGPGSKGGFSGNFEFDLIRWWIRYFHMEHDEVTDPDEEYEGWWDQDTDE
jgi:hypothetical protein